MFPRVVVATQKQAYSYSHFNLLFQLTMQPELDEEPCNQLDASRNFLSARGLRKFWTCRKAREHIETDEKRSWRARQTLGLVGSAENHLVENAKSHD